MNTKLFSPPATIPSATALILALLGTPLSAQAPNPQCGAEGAAGLLGGDACQKAIDLFRYMNPQLGMLIAGGNATLGQAGTLGGLGHFAITLRANATPHFRLPDVPEDLSEGPVQRSDFTVTETIGAFPVMDGALGLYRGARLGPTRVGGIDALVNVFYIPEQLRELLEGGDSGISFPDGGLRLGYGARVGLVEETRALPSVSITYIQRGLPKVNMIASTTSEFEGDAFSRATPSDTLALRNLDIRADSWRFVVGKRLWIVTLAAGIGQDRYNTRGELTYAVYSSSEDERTSGEIRLGERITRTNMFADLSINLYLFKVVGEIGRTTGGELITYNAFSVPADKPQIYFALGIRQGR